jgi:hypothetical protein
MSALGGPARRAVTAIEGFLLEPAAGSNGSRLGSSETEVVGAALRGSAEPPADDRRSEPVGEIAPASPPTLILASSVGGAGGGAALAAAVGVAAATAGMRPAGVLLADLDPPPRARGPTMLAAAPAWELEDALRGLGPSFAGAAARGHLCHLALPPEDGLDLLSELMARRPPVARVFAHVPERMWAAAVDRDLGAAGGLLQAELPADRALVALAVRELHERGMRARVAGRPLGRVAARRALAGMDPGGTASRRAARLARGLMPPRQG